MFVEVKYSALEIELELLDWHKGIIQFDKL